MFWIGNVLYHKHKISTLKSLIQTGDVAGVSQMITAHPELLQADLDQERMSQLKPLSLAAGLGQEAICSNLLALGENVNEQDRYHYTPLHHTILPDQTNTAVLLLRQGADLKIKDFEGLTPLDYAKNTMRPEI